MKGCQPFHCCSLSQESKSQNLLHFFLLPCLCIIWDILLLQNQFFNYLKTFLCVSLSNNLSCTCLQPTSVMPPTPGDKHDTASYVLGQRGVGGVDVKHTAAYHRDCSTVHKNQEVEPVYMSMRDKWIKKSWYVYTVEYYSTAKRNTLMRFAGKWLEAEIVVSDKVWSRPRKIQIIWYESRKKVLREGGGVKSKG